MRVISLDSHLSLRNLLSENRHSESLDLVDFVLFFVPIPLLINPLPVLNFSLSFDVKCRIEIPIRWLDDDFFGQILFIQLLEMTMVQKNECGWADIKVCFWYWSRTQRYVIRFILCINLNIVTLYLRCYSWWQSSAECHEGDNLLNSLPL